MHYKPALRDGSDPLYSPHTRTVKGRWRYWSPSKPAIAAGHAKQNVRLPGEIGDGRDAERAREARRLTIAMLDYIDAEEDGPPQGTWGWLIWRYRVDRWSPMRDQKANTQELEVWLLERWDAAIGHMRITDLDYVCICEIRDGMRRKGRSPSYVSRMFNGLRRIAKYGRVLKIDGISDVSLTLSEMRLAKGPKRSIVPTGEQIRAVVDAAGAAGESSFALSVLLQWHFALRAADVRGQWFEITPDDAEAGGVVRRSTVVRRGEPDRVVWSRWQDGLTWEMMEPGLTGFRKVPSKTEKSLADPIRFGFEHLPEIRARLRLLATGSHFGPVITSERRTAPFTKYGWAQAWARHRKTAGLPDDIRAMDIRAGAISEAKGLGADGLTLRDAAGHLLASTTDGYARDRSDGVAKIVELRNRRKTG